MIDYKGKTALVTGAASGIGAAMARALAERGARLICADLNVEGAAATAADCGADALGLHTDLSRPEAPQALLDEAWKAAGGIDLLCSNAGIGHRGSLAETRFDATLERLFEVNFYAGMKLAQAYLQRLGETGGRGRLMVTASENSLSVPGAVSGSRMAFYAASKHALLVAMEWLRIECEGGPLELHVLMPGAVYTPLISRVLPDPSLAPPELELIMPDQCADIALRGMDLELFYIPTQAHLLDDMQPRLQGVEDALKALGIRRVF